VSALWVSSPRRVFQQNLKRGCAPPNPPGCGALTAAALD
jgi:hypothetical protein